VGELIDALWLTGGADAALCLARRTTGGEPGGIAAARSAREGSRPAHEIVSAAADGVRGATAFERCCAIAALIACDELEMASHALAACTRAAAGRGGGAELGMLERLRARLRAVEGDEHALLPTLPGPDPGPAPWREWLDDADAVARFGTPSARAEALIASRSGIDAFAEAVAIVRGSPRPALLAGALLRLGRALRHAGRRREARAVLGEARAIAQRLGATKLEGQVREERGVAGARPRREMLTGPDSLTAAERRVAGAAVAGWTNREIADGLFLSRKTVEMHLGRVYRKLDIRSRDELPAVMSPITSQGDSWRHDRGRIAS
jgi:DNA-binding CsgD family transcriptional regulator